MGFPSPTCDSHHHPHHHHMLTTTAFTASAQYRYQITAFHRTMGVKSAVEEHQGTMDGAESAPTELQQVAAGGRIGGTPPAVGSSMMMQKLRRRRWSRRLARRRGTGWVWWEASYACRAAAKASELSAPGLLYAAFCSLPWGLGSTFWGARSPPPSASTSSWMINNNNNTW